MAKNSMTGGQETLSHPLNPSRKSAQPSDSDCYTETDLLPKVGRNEPVIAVSRKSGEALTLTVCDAPGEIERPSQPEPEPERQSVRTVLVGESRVAGQVRQTRLMPLAVLLLRRIAIRNPDRWHMAAHHVVHDTSRARRVGLMHDPVRTMEDPMVGIRPFDANAGLVAGDDAGAAQDRPGLRSLVPEPGVRTEEYVHQHALAHIEPERIAEHPAQTRVFPLFLLVGGWGMDDVCEVFAGR
nr:hypothetical protein [Komagataeibacter medellinensis]